MLIALYCAGRYLVLDSLRFEANDLSPVYVAARLVADGKAASLYDHHPYLFNLVSPGEFKETAAQCGFKGTITPYVHLPLFAFLARPLLSVTFSVITILLLLTNVAAVVLSLFLILRLLDRQPALTWLCMAIAVLASYYPLRYGLRLGQTTPLVFLGITSLYYLYRFGFPKLSGMLLGLIISLKITPILLFCYFLIKKKWSVAISTAITLLVMGTASVTLAGWQSNLAFANHIVRLSGLSLASWNNQSVDGFLLRWETGALHLYDWHLLPLPPIIKALKYASMACVLLLWWSALLKSNRKNSYYDLLVFTLTLSISVICAPIAWTHYLLFLIFPCLVLVCILVTNKQIPCRTWLLGGIVISYISAALPPAYLVSLINIPVVHYVPLPALSSGGFVGGALLLLINLIMLFSKHD